MTSTGRADGRRNRRHILDTGARLLLDGERLTASAVASRAGLTRATVYRHFRDRDALVRAVLDRIAGVVLTDVLASMSALPLTDALGELAAAVVDAADRFGRLASSLPVPLDDLARAAAPGEPVLDVLRARRAAGEIGADAPDEWLAVAVRALCLAAVREVAAGRPRDVVTGWLTESLRRSVD